MKKRRGFTLIELLSVIVILTIISLITIPVIFELIENSKKESAQRSIEGVIEAAKYFYASKMINNNYITEDLNVSCDSKQNKCIVDNFNEELKIDGDVPSGYFVLSKKCKVNPNEETILKINDYYVTLLNNKITSIIKTLRT